MEKRLGYSFYLSVECLFKWAEASFLFKKFYLIIRNVAN